MEYPVIDAVFTWVDGADPVWRAQKQALRHTLFGEDAVPEDADSAARFRDNEELRYALRSFARYAPWVRRVHLVTADQKPAWLNTETVNLVSHRDIFPESVPLPVFSTRPIEFCVHRIPGLAEHFLYANDDFMLGRAVSPGEFFLPDGTPVLWVLRRSEQYMARVRAKISGTNSHASAIARAHALVADRYGKSFPYIIRHYPRSMTRSTAYALWEAFPEAVRKTLLSPFRSPEDVTVTALYPLHMLAEGKGVARVINGPQQVFDVVSGRGPAYMGVSLGEKKSARKMRAIRLLRPRTYCLNDAPGATEEERASLRDFLHAQFPTPCHYERAGE